jgi:hypothetical protein
MNLIPFFFSGVVANVSCYDQIDGSITLNLSGGTQPWTTTWTSSVAGWVDPGTDNISGLDSGSYFLNVIDDAGCSYDTTFIITKPSEIFADGDITDVVCYNNADGTITLNTNGGVPDWSWNWSGPAGFSSTDTNLVGIDTGTYNLTITDS